MNGHMLDIRGPRPLDVNAQAAARLPPCQAVLPRASCSLSGRGTPGETAAPVLRRTLLKYLLLFGGEPTKLDALAGRDDSSVQAEIAQWWARNRQAGRIVVSTRLKPPLTATTVRFEDRRALICDGPCTPEAEAVAGYGVIDVDDLDEALALVRTWPGGGYIEIRPILSRSDRYFQ